MKKRNPCSTALVSVFLAVGVLAMASCGRDAIFSIIYHEVPPVPPMVRGGPTNIVVFDWEFEWEGGDRTPRPVLFVASGDLFWYSAEFACGCDADDPGAGCGCVDGCACAADPGDPSDCDCGEDCACATPGNCRCCANDADCRAGNCERRVRVGSGWGRNIGINQPGGKIIDIAVTQRHLYALSMAGTGVSTTVFRIKSGRGSWERIDSPAGSIQSIFASGDRLFAGVRTGSATGPVRAVYGIFSVSDEGNAFEQVVDDARPLTGAIMDGDYHLLSTGGGSVYRVDGATATPLLRHVPDPDENDDADDESDPGEDVGPPVFVGMIMGMIGLPDNSIIAVSRGGPLYMVEGDYLKRIPLNAGGDISTGRLATGALALWRGTVAGDDDGVVLVAGVQGSLTATTFNNGYVEFRLTPAGALDTSASRHDADQLVSVQGQNDQYRTSLGRLPINHLFQVPPEIDENMTFFASTQTAGLWSFRYREGRYQWNAEN